MTYFSFDGLLEELEVFLSNLYAIMYLNSLQRKYYSWITFTLNFNMFKKHFVLCQTSYYISWVWIHAFETPRICPWCWGKYFGDQIPDLVHKLTLQWLITTFKFYNSWNEKKSLPTSCKEYQKEIRSHQI